MSWAYTYAPETVYAVPGEGPDGNGGQTFSITGSTAYWVDDGGGSSGGGVQSPTPSAYEVQVPYTYYQDQTSTTSYNGVVVGQTIVAPRAGWVTGFNLFFTQIGATGNVQVLLCKTKGGKPDLKRVLSQVTLNQADMKKYPLATHVALPPAMLQSGQRVALVLVTTGGHYVAMADAGYTEGTFFWGTDGDYFMGDISKDMKFEMLMAKFRAPRTEIVLQNMSLAGGIGEIDIKTQQPKFDGTSMTYEIQVGGIWYPLSPNSLGHLATQPDIVPVRAVFLGTSDIQPGLQLASNAIKVSRDNLSRTICSAAISTPAKQYFQVDLLVDIWNASHNTLTMTLLTRPGDTGSTYSTVTASSTSVVLVEDVGTKRRLRCTFNVGSAVTSYKVKAVMTRDAGYLSPTVSERTSVGTA
jgi:hypothetical protein